jgi:hypothetical protein
MVDARGNVSAMLETEAFTPQYTPAGQLAAYLGTDASGEGNTVTLTGAKAITTDLTIPGSVSLVVNSGVSLTIGGGTFTVAGTLTVNGTFAVSGGNLAGTGTLNGSGQVILAGPDGAEPVERQITPTSGLFTFSGTLAGVSFGADSALSLANAIEYAGDGNTIEILGNIGNKETDTKGFHIYSIVEKAITVTQGAGRPYTIYGSIYVYGDTNDEVTLSNLKIETLKIPYSGFSGEMVKEKPFLSSIGGVADHLNITDCEISVSSTANSLVNDSPNERTPIYSGIKIIPLTNNPSYNFSGNTVTGLKSPYKTTGITIGMAGSDVANWADRYPAIQSNTAYTTDNLKSVDLTENESLFVNFFDTFKSWHNTITGFDNEAVIRNDQHASKKAEKVYYGNEACYSYGGLKDALNWSGSVNNTTYRTEVYLGVTASVIGNLEISKATTLIIEDGVTLTITGDLTAGEDAKIQLCGSAVITVTGTGNPGLSGEGTYTYGSSTWTK